MAEGGIVVLEALLVGVTEIKNNPQFKMYSFLIPGNKKTLTIIGDGSLEVPEELTKVKAQIRISGMTYKVQKDGREYDRDALQGFVVGFA